ncbi:MAG: ATP-binding protein [Myxococcales bacterium]|nr:ATP-binding protein [Myxococcales bacterium]
MLVGAQGTGKSLALQWLKTAIDGKHILEWFEDLGYDVDAEDWIDFIFGDGMGPAWTSHTQIRHDGKLVTLKTLARSRREQERVFFIPAHRALLISDGWAAPFHKLTSEIPVVARLFSQHLFDRFRKRHGDRLFPRNQLLRPQYRRLIDDAIYHGGQLGIETDATQARRLKLTHGESRLPFMTWTAGQREFTPLLLGLSHLLPPRDQSKDPDVDWVVIEEPEMGLHPQAIAAFLLLALDLLARGYRVVLSTHSPLVLAAAWMLRRLRETGANWQLVCDAFDLPTKGRALLKPVADAALASAIRVHHLAFADDGKVRSKDISSLDPGSDDDDISGWGGLVGFSSRFGEVVRRAVNEADR